MAIYSSKVERSNGKIVIVGPPEKAHVPDDFEKNGPLLKRVGLLIFGVLVLFFTIWSVEIEKPTEDMSAFHEILH